MPRNPRDPINDLFNEILDATITTVIDTMTPEFNRIARQAVATAKAQADAKAQQHYQQRQRQQQHKKSTDGQKSAYTNSRPHVHPPQLTNYDVLEVSPRASQETIEAAYKSLVKKHHPDVGGNTVMMQQITAAYSVLKDPAKRRQYDRTIGVL